MRSELMSGLIGALLLGSPAAAEEGAMSAACQAQGTATLPLPDLLSLHQAQQANEALAKARPALPPVPAAIQRIDLTGHLLDQAVELTAKVEVAVLSDSEWVKVPILEKTPDLSVLELPALEEGALMVEKDRLTFVTKTRGLHVLELRLLKRAAVTGDRRSVQIGLASTAMAVLVLRYDEDLFRLIEPTATRDPAGVRIYPSDDGFHLTWAQISAIAKRAEDERRPPIESLIERAHGALVSTLEGNQVLHVKYDLRFEGTKPIELTIPDGWSAQKAYLNGVATAFEQREDVVPLSVTPARAGDQSATVELVLIGAPIRYHLSGNLGVTLPGASWPTHELFLDLHLPRVFNYVWSGGSLAPVEEPSPELALTGSAPRPGKEISFHQELVGASRATVRVSYTVDLTEQYYRAQ